MHPVARSTLAAADNEPTMSVRNKQIDTGSNRISSCRTRSGTQNLIQDWIPAFAGMMKKEKTTCLLTDVFFTSSRNKKGSLCIAGEPFLCDVLIILASSRFCYQRFAPLHISKRSDETTGVL
jgi:hypothetical protein